MNNLKQLKINRDLINAIDWDMTPEEAVRLYLEWGNNWSRGVYSIKSKDDVTYYFVLNTWEEFPIVYLVKRNSEEVVELAKIDIPEELLDRFYKEQKGVFAVEGKVRKWLREELNAA